MIERRHKYDENIGKICADPKCDKETTGNNKYCQRHKNEHQKKYRDSKAMVSIAFLKEIYNLVAPAHKLYIEKIFKKQNKIIS